MLVAEWDADAGEAERDGQRDIARLPFELRALEVALDTVRMRAPSQPLHATACRDWSCR